jgi:hypothetical protein
MVTKIREKAGVRPDDELAAPTWAKVGRVEREDYHIDRLVLRTGSRVPLPVLTFHLNAAFGRNQRSQWWSVGVENAAFYCQLDAGKQLDIHWSRTP